MDLRQTLEKWFYKYIPPYQQKSRSLRPPQYQQPFHRQIQRLPGARQQIQKKYAQALIDTKSISFF